MPFPQIDIFYTNCEAKSFFLKIGKGKAYTFKQVLFFKSNIALTVSVTL